MPHITEVDSDHEKENKPPIDHDIIAYFDQKFPDYKDYRHYIENHLADWLSDPDFRIFDAAYCHHRLALGHLQTLTAMIDTLKKGIRQSQDLDNTQRNNIQKGMPSLLRNGVYTQIVRTLIDPPKVKKERRTKKGTCPKCRLPYIYDHVAWCRGLDSGYTCRCDRKPLQPTKEEPEPSTSSAVILRTSRLKCFTCGSHTHLKPDCPHYHCRYCKRSAPGHWVRSCPYSPHKRTTPKQEEADSWDHYSDGYYDIYGSEDGNLTGEH